ncbi:MAG: TetR/AcrR family transcriptional regulator [Lachnospiraceae bacterium]
MHNTYTETQKFITKESIITALLKLLETHSFQEISITEITKLAGVSRMAFYRNYETKEDIISFYLDDMSIEFFNKFKHVASPSKQVVLFEFFSFFYQKKDFLNILIKADILYLFEYKLSASLFHFFRNIESKSKPEYKSYLARFDSGGLHQVLMEWIKNDTPESPETMASLICQFTC